MKLKSGIKLLAETIGTGPAVRRQTVYAIRLQMWLNQGEPVRWSAPWGLVDRSTLCDSGHTLLTDLRVDRESMFDGLFQGVQGMHVGGTRKLKISPHLGFGARGIPGTVPENAALILEITILAERHQGDGADARSAPSL